MNFVDGLKAKLKKQDRVDFVKSIRDNPEYERVLEKLRQLTAQRESIQKALMKVELDIDACLVLIEMKREKDEIDKDKNIQIGEDKNERNY